MADANSFTYVWEALHPTEVDANGMRRVITGEMQAANEDIVRATVEGRGLIPIKIASKTRLGGDKEWSIAKITGIPSGKVMAEAYRQLASLVKAGVSLPESVAAVAEGSSELMVRETFAEVRDNITQGRRIDEAMKDHPKVFDDMTVQLLRAAVEGGFVAQTLLRVADITENKNKIRKKIRGAIMMPAFSVVAAIGVGIMMTIVMIPSMAKMLEDMNPGEPLPLNTQMLLWFSDHAIIIIPTLIALGVGWFFLNRRVLRYHLGYQRAKSKIMLKVPVFGRLTRLQALAQTSRGLEMMISAGVRQSEALAIIAPTQTNHLYRDATEELALATTEGRRLSDVMVNYPELYDFAFVKMVQTGENAGSLDEMLANIATQKEEDVDDMTDTLAALLNPLAMSVVGVILGFLAMAMFGPMLSVASSL